MLTNIKIVIIQRHNQFKGDKEDISKDAPGYYRDEPRLNAGAK